MDAATRANLTRNLNYHASVREFYQAKVDQEEKDAPADKEKPAPRGHAAAKPLSVAATLVALHNDVVKDLSAVLADDAPLNILHAQQEDRPRRDNSVRMRGVTRIYH